MRVSFDWEEKSINYRRYWSRCPYLAEFLLAKGCDVRGIKRRASSLNTQRVDHIYEDSNIVNHNFALHYDDLTDSSNLTNYIKRSDDYFFYNHNHHIPL